MDIELSTRGVLTAFFRQQKRFFILSLVVVVLGVVYIARQPAIYEAHASMLVKFGREALPNLSRADNQSSADVTSDRREIMVSLTSILLSADLLREAVAEYGLDKLYPDLAASSATPEMDAITILMRNDLHVSLADKSNIITVNVWNRDPAVATDFAKILINRFLARQNEIFNPPRTDFLQQQVSEAREKLENAQRAFQNFKEEVQISSLDDEMKQLISEKSELSQLAFRAVTDAQDKLADAQAKETELLATMRASSPLVARQRTLVAQARKQVEERQADLNARPDEMKDSTLAAKLQHINERIKYLEDNRGRYQELEQRVSVGEDNYKYYLERSEEARASNMLNEQNITRISVVDQPLAGPTPVRPRKLVLLAATLLAAGLFGLMLVVYLEMSDERIRTPHQITQRLRLPVLATFSGK